MPAIINKVGGGNVISNTGFPGGPARPGTGTGRWGDTNNHPQPTGMPPPTGWWTGWGPRERNPQDPAQTVGFDWHGHHFSWSNPSPSDGGVPWWYGDGGSGPGDWVNPWETDPNSPGGTPLVPDPVHQRHGGGGGGNIPFNFDPNNPFGPPPNILQGGGFMPWAPIMPNGAGGWSGQGGGPGGGGFPGMPGGGGGFPGMGGGGGAGPFPPALPGDPMAGGLNAFQTYLSAVPVMEGARDKNISEAMANAGFTGNRFGSAAMNKAGQIGAATALQQNQLLANLMHDETNNTLNRGLQATGMGLQNEQFRNDLAMRASMGDRDAMMQAAQLGIGLGTSQDQMMQDRIRMLQGMGSWEQGRQDQFSRTGLDQFNQDRLGMLPTILQALGAGGGGAGSGGGSSQTQNGGSPGFMDYAMPILLAMLA